MKVAEIKKEIDKWEDLRESLRHAFEKVGAVCESVALTFDVIPDNELISEIGNYLATLEDRVAAAQDRLTDLGLVEGKIRGLAKSRK